MAMIRILVLVALLWPTQAMALSCVAPQADYIPTNDLIAKVRIIAIDDNWFSEDKFITFEIIDLYKGPVGAAPVIKASWSRFYQTWGPQMKVGQVGEYLFDYKMGSGWSFSGPGGCTFVSDAVWEKLRENKVSPVSGE